MVRSAIRALAAVLLLGGILGDRAQAVPPVNTVEWVGGSTGEWNNADAWKNTTTNVTGNALTLMGQRNGSDGMNNINPATTRARNIVIGGGATVNYYYPTGNTAGTGGADPSFRQGTNFTITGGATYLIDQATFTNMSGNAWGRMDPSNLILDNGTFWKKGQPPDQVPDPAEGFPGGPVGGGPTIFGSFNVDNNLERLGEPVVNIQIKNGGQLKNDGQLWFGTDGENTPDTRVSMTINNGSMDLSGGNIYFVENGDLIVNADLAFFYDYQERSPADPNLPVVRPARPKDEKYEINFTGPGSITVDNAGIWVYEQNSTGTWNEGTAGPLEYVDLWEMGILKANGLSGRTDVLFGDGAGPRTMTPANFSDFFITVGTPGTDNYTLTATANTTIPTVEWVGGATGEWNNANAWKNTTTNVTGNALTLMGQRNGSDGMNTTNPTTTRARNIVIGGGATVNYYYPTGNAAGTGGADPSFRQGTSLTITGGATYLIDQATFTNMSGNAWGRMDMSNLIIDGGTFWKKGQPPDQVPDPAEGFPGGPVGGGPTIFGSFNVDNNLERLGEPVVNVVIKNGGQLKNDGQLWFGTDGENTPDTRVSFTINNGHMDLSGGDVYFVENGDLIVNADLAFFYDYQERSPADPNLPVVRPARPKDEKYEINFTGPGSITVDNAGIWVYEQNSTGTWNEGTAGPLEYVDLWEMGILKANGLSGRTDVLFGDGAGPRTMTPADFNTFFSVTGTPGMDNYILTSLIAGAAVVGLTGDYNNNGIVDASDYVLWRKGGPLANDPTPGNDAGDYNVWRTNFGKTAAPGGGAATSAAVPEPAAGLMLLIGMLLPFSLRRARAVVQ